MRAPQPVRRSSRTKRRVKAPEPDSNSESDEVDIDQVRRARTDYYSTPSEEKKMRDDEEPIEDSCTYRRRREKERSGERFIQGDEEYESRNGHRHTSHRRKRKKRRFSEGDEGSIYKITEKGPHVQEQPGREPYRPTVTGHRTSSAPTPERMRILRKLGLETPQRSRSHKTYKPRSDLHSKRGTRSKIEVGHELREREQERVSNAPLPKIRPRRSASLQESSTQSASRPSLGRSQTTTRKVKRIPPLPPVAEEPKTSPVKSVQRSHSVFGSWFGPPQPSVPEAKVQCLTCLDDIPASRAPKLTCGHRMCHPCLKRLFTLSVTDPAHMPPKCCTEDCIPLKHVEKIFDTKFKTKWNKKYHEYTTKNRIYCPAKGCGTWIPPNAIKVDQSGGASGGRKYGVCPRCKTQVCGTCNSKRHKSKECPKDESTQRFAEMARANGWMRCYNCSATVELKEGCNHMTCRCTAEFCMICGSKWKTCDCPWFNYGTVEADRLNHMNIAQVREEMARGNPIFNQPRAYHEEIEQRRAQERDDEDLARRLQGLYVEANNHRTDIWGVGNAAGHFLNENYLQRAHEILTAPFNPAGQAAAYRLIAEIRGQQRIDTNAIGIDVPVPNPTRPVPNVAPNAPPDTPPAPPVARLRRASAIRRPSAFRRSTVIQEDPFVDNSADRAPRPEDQRRSAILAGLSRRPTIGRVEAWREHVGGDDEGFEM